MLRRVASTILLLAALATVPFTALAYKRPTALTPAHASLRVQSLPALDPHDRYIIVDGLDYPVPRNINRKPGFPKQPSNPLVGPTQPELEVYTAVDPNQ